MTVPGPDGAKSATGLPEISACRVQRWIHAAAGDKPRRSHYRHLYSLIEGCRVQPSPANSPTPASPIARHDEQRALPL